MKGSLEFIGLAFVMVLMILLPLIAGIFLGQREISAELKSDTADTVGKFKAYIISPVFLNKTVKQNISIYDYKGNTEKEEIKNTLQNRSNKTHSKISIGLESSNTDESLIDLEGARSRSEFKIASPDDETVSVELSVGENESGVEAAV